MTDSRIEHDGTLIEQGKAFEYRPPGGPFDVIRFVSRRPWSFRRDDDDDPPPCPASAGRPVPFRRVEAIAAAA